MNIHRGTALTIIGIVAVLAGGSCLAQGLPDTFGTTTYLKQYPEYQRGYDPWANLSGTLQENVDLYSGKLNLTFPLPTIPWSATKAFGPVLLYNSNVWARSESVSLCIGGETTATKSPGAAFVDVPPQERPEPPSVFLPEFYCNDSWVRFSPIGKPHGMPGWTLTVGGVYTEYTPHPEPLMIWTSHLSRAVKKKYFVAPDGSSHLLVDFETNCRPYFSMYQIGLEATPETALERCMLPYGYMGSQHLCLPHSDVAAERVWRALDGSGYYYIEKQLVPQVNETTLGNVYGPDGTCYVLDENGVITALRDLDGNTINVSVHEYNKNSETDWYKTVVYTNWGGAKITVKFRCKPLVNWVGQPNGREMDWENQAIECWVLDTVSGPKVGDPNGEETITFECRNLLEHLNLPAEGNRSVRDPILWRDIFYDNMIDPLSGDPMDFGDTMFCTQSPPDQPSPEDYMAQPNREIYVMTSITLPDNRQFRFTYNIAGKIAAITYPDGGSRTYWYGNTPGRSHDDKAFFRRAACQGESALGGVSMVWQGNPSAGVLERAYAYSNPKSNPVITDTTIDYVSTLLWKGDKSVEVHDFYPQPSGGSVVLDFGFSGWTTGKSKRTRLFDFSSFTYGDAAETFRNRFRCPAPPYTEWDDPNAGLASMMSWMNATDTNWLREETLDYRNDFVSGPKVWEWTLPTVYCDSGNCTNYNDLSNPSTITGFFTNVIPTPGTCNPPQSGWYTPPGAFPDANPVVTGKTLKLRESGQVLTKTIAITWADVYPEPNAVKTLETETDWNGSGPAVRKEYTFAPPFWPGREQVTGNLPGRLLGLPLTEKITDGSGQRVAETVHVYAEPFGTPASFHPIETDQWIEGSRWAKSTYHYGGSPLRLTSVETWDGGVAVSSAAFAYDDSGSKLLKEAAVKDGDNTVQKIFFKYDPYTGLLLRRTDLNGNPGGDEIGEGDNYLQMDYDQYNRLVGVRLKHSGAADIQLTSLAYSNAGAPFRVTRKDYVNAGCWKETVTENDSFGRPAKGSTTLGNDQVGSMQWALGWKDYDVLGRVAAEWGPAKSASNDLWGSVPAPRVETYYDALGRVTAKSRFSPAGEWVSSWGSQYGAAVDGSRGFTTEKVADEMSRWRKLYKDGLGRIARVDEQNPDSGSSWRTDYLYDTLGNLTQVHKHNAGGGNGQVRTFTYDALGRLLSADLPEFDHQALRYQYDDRGNLLYKRKDQPGQGTQLLEEMTYDGLGRILSRTVTHEGRTTCNTFGYDQGMYEKGRLIWDRSETEGTVVLRTYTYEWRGLLDHRQDVITRGGSTEYFTTSYEYEPGCALKKAIYPSGVVVENTAGSGGVVDNVKVGDSSSTSTVYQRLSNAANGAPEAVRYIEGLGTVNGGRVYDPTTLWLKELKVGPGVDPGTVLDNSLVMFGLYYDYEKNGNVKEMNRFWRQTAGADCSSLNGTYTYDKLNRLKTYQFSDTRLGTTVNSYRYLMDEYGNLLAEQRLNGVNPAPGGMSVTVDAGTNRLAGKPHDALGNLLRVDGPGGAPLDLAYHDFGHVAEVKDARTGLLLHRYFYDAEGKRRVKERLSPSGIVTGVSYVFYEGEDLICERDAGELVQPEDSYTRKFLLKDHLGTTRAELTFNASNNPVVDRIHDTMPYGEPIIPDPQSSESVLFTGKQRDAESGLDCFGARFYSNNQGRWGSPDLPFVGKTVENPLSWNLYSYVLLNPIGNFDPNGLFAASFHRQLVIDALATLDMKQGEERILFGRTTPMSDAAYNADIDLTKKQHFDNMQSLNEIFDNYANMEQEVCYGFWEVKCGSALHAMQDFYCHTNYIGLYLMVHPDAKPGEIPTLSQAMASKDQAFKNLLFSGMLLGGLWGLFSEKNVTALGHDNVEITSTSTLGNKLSPAGYHLYEYAEALAFQETCIQLARRKFKGNRYATFDVIVTGDLGSLQVTRPSR